MKSIASYAHAEKRRIYLMVLPFGCVVAIAAGSYALLVPDAALVAWAIPFASAAMLAAFAWGFAVRPEAFDVLERAMVAAVAVVVVTTLLAATLFAPEEQAENLLTIARLGFWMPIVVAFTFLALGVRSGAIVAWVLWAALAAVVATHLFLPAGHETIELVTMVESLTANALAILLLSGFARVARVTERRAAAMEAEAHTDVLTGLANRRHAEGVLEEEVERSERYERPLSVLLFDLDHFKEVNDAFGHDAGDRVLSEMRDLLEQRLRDSDVLARWGGEEFLLIAPEMRDAEAGRLAERLRRLIELHDFGTGTTLTASFGVAERRCSETAAELVRRADECMYAAKRAGRNTVRVARGAGEPATAVPSLNDV